MSEDAGSNAPESFFSGNFYFHFEKRKFDSEAFTLFFVKDEKKTNFFLFSSNFQVFSELIFRSFSDFQNF